MTRDRELDDVLREWVDHGDERLPHRYLAAALAEIETAPQRGARRAPLEGLLMRLQPLAVPLGIVAVLALAIGAVAMVARPPSVGPMPSPSTPSGPPEAVQINGEFSTEAFAQSLSLTLPSAPDPAGWFVAEGSGLISIASSSSALDRLVIADPAQARVVDQNGGSAELPADLVAWLDDQPGVAAQALQAFDREGQESYVIEGQEVPVYSVTIDAADGASRALVDTPDGPALSVPEVPTEWWLLRFASERGDLLLIATSERDGEETFLASFISMAESITLR